MKCDYCLFVCVFLIFGTSVIYGRVPPRNHETEETPVNDKENPILTPVERSPIDSSINNENPIDKQTTNRKPIGVILFRTQPTFSFRERSPFSPAFPLSPHHHHFSNFGSDANEDPALRLISILFGRHQRPILPTESTDTETANTSNESSSADTTDLERRHPFESLFPSIFVPRLDEFDKEMGSETTTDDKTPDNFENKEKKVITISGKKFVKTTQVKKVKNDFGQFHSVISSLQPFDEKLHDENGNDKIKPDLDNKETSSTVEKKQVESSTVSNEKVDSSTAKSVQFDSSTAASVDKEEVTELKETSSPKPNDKLLAENLSKDVSKNEIPDKKETEIKVDQMN